MMTILRAVGCAEVRGASVALRRSSSRTMRFLSSAHPTGVFAYLVVLLLVFACCPAAAADTLDAWRAEAVQTRKLADLDAPRAYAEAQRLQANLPGGAPAEDRARMLNVLARAEIHMALIGQAEKHAKLALDLATRHDDRVGQAEAELNRVLLFIYQGKIDALTTAAMHAVALLDGVDRPDLLGEAMSRASMMYRRIGMTDESVTMAMQTEEIARHSKNPVALAHAEHGLAISYWLSNRVKESQEHSVKTRELARAAGLKWMEVEALARQASRASDLGDLPRAEVLAREEIVISREFGSPFTINLALYNVAELMNKQGRYAEAERTLDGVVATYGKYPNPLGLWFALNARSSNYQALGEMGRARADAERAYALAKEINFPQYLSDSARRLAALAAARGDHRRAYALSVEATEMAEKQVREKSSASILQLTERYHTEAKQREINQLTNHNQLQAAELKQRSLERQRLWVMLSGAAAMMLVAAFFLFHQQNVKAKIRALNAKLDQLVQARTAELQRQTRYLRTLIDALPLPVWLKDIDSRFLAVNRAAAAFLGHSVEEMLGKPGGDFLPAGHEAASYADEADVIVTRKEKIVEKRFETAQGTAWQEIYMAPVLDEDDSVLGTVGFARDVGAQKAMEAAHAAALAESQQLARMRSEFMAQVSHELRTPLNGILGYAQLLQQDEMMSAQQIAGLNIIRQSGDHLLTLINNILDHVSLDEQKLELRFSDIPLDTFFRSIAGIIRSKAEQKNLELICEMAADLPHTIRGDAQRLRQVLLKLLGNAAKFTDRGWISLRVDFSLPSRLRVEILDTGVGIGENQLKTIFQSFTQDSGAHRWSGGTGLGLSISRQLVRLMGGEIKVESRIGAGSIFSFEVVVAVVQTKPVETEILAAREAPALKAALPDALLAPPQQELEILHGLAMRGNMRKIEQRADHLAELDERYRPFANQLRRLADGYQSQAILSLVEQCQEEGGVA